MNQLDIQSCLDSMEILIDTREQMSQRAEKRYNTFSVPFYRQKLNYGDYTYNFMLPNGNKYYSDDRIDPEVVIERKMNLEELSGCFCQQRERFKAEFERAKEKGAKVYLLVEDATYEKLINGGYKTKFNSAAFLASLLAWSIRYDFRIVFCKKETAGKMIKEILYRELKEKLEQGYYG